MKFLLVFLPCLLVHALYQGTTAPAQDIKFIVRIQLFTGTVPEDEASYKTLCLGSLVANDELDTIITSRDCVRIWELLHTQIGVPAIRAGSGANTQVRWGGYWSTFSQESSTAGELGWIRVGSPFAKTSAVEGIALRPSSAGDLTDNTAVKVYGVGCTTPTHKLKDWNGMGYATSPLCASLENDIHVVSSLYKGTSGKTTFHNLWSTLTNFNVNVDPLRYEKTDRLTYIEQKSCGGDWGAPVVYDGKLLGVTLGGMCAIAFHQSGRGLVGATCNAQGAGACECLGGPFSQLLHMIRTAAPHLGKSELEHLLKTYSGDGSTVPTGWTDVPDFGCGDTTSVDPIASIPKHEAWWSAGFYSTAPKAACPRAVTLSRGRRHADHEGVQICWQYTGANSAVPFNVVRLVFPAGYRFETGHTPGTWIQGVKNQPKVQFHNEEGVSGVEFLWSDLSGKDNTFEWTTDNTDKRLIIEVYGFRNPNNCEQWQPAEEGDDNMAKHWVVGAFKCPAKDLLNAGQITIYPCGNEPVQANPYAVVATEPNKWDFLQYPSFCSLCNGCYKWASTASGDLYQCEQDGVKFTRTLETPLDTESCYINGVNENMNPPVHHRH